MALHSVDDVQKRKSVLVRRSRFGCRNCKLRKLKCDEAKPQCKRCKSYGVLCNFVPGVSDLQLVAGAAATGKPPILHGRGAQPRSPITSAVWTADASTSYQLNTRCQDFITRYLGRSLVGPRDATTTQVNRKLLELAFTHPFLMHASLAVALTYDRYLNRSSNCRRTVEECFHLSESTVLLNKRLENPIKTEDKDAIWGTAAALALVTFASPDASTPEQAWPLKSSPNTDLEWLPMVRTKMSLWNLMDPMRPDSLFRVMAATFDEMQTPLPETGIDGIPEELAAVCNLEESSTPRNNPYFSAAHAVCRILGLPDSEVTTGGTVAFTLSIRGTFYDMLRERDPVALLLLYLWYRKAGRSIWWIELRARVECPAIRRYLQSYLNVSSIIESMKI
ncbi:hypothetical protein GGS20DRAFT_481097 [Poronia punctata]|nr:hypothetical protein GGS20DRAFT_481097 [Poronia punctata]